MITYITYIITFLSVIGFLSVAFTPKGPPALLVLLLNTVALCGWVVILLLLVQAHVSSSSYNSWLDNDEETKTTTSTPFSGILNLTLSLEYIAFVEVLRIFRKQLGGNFVLGIVLHCIRTGMVLSGFTRLLLPPYNEENGTFWIGMILWTWSITEVSRYPMYLVPSSKVIRLIRMVVPVVTFPLGAGSEAYVSFLLLKSSLGGDAAAASGAAEWMARSVFGLTLLINAVLGPTMAYPAIVSKAIKELSGKGQKKESMEEQTDASTTTTAVKKRKKARKDD